jgi:hypothetical protein
MMKNLAKNLLGTHSIRLENETPIKEPRDYHLITLREHLGSSPGFGGLHVARLFRFLLF